MHIGIGEALIVIGICVIVFIPTIVAFSLVAIRSRSRQKSKID